MPDTRTTERARLLVRRQQAIGELYRAQDTLAQINREIAAHRRSSPLPKGPKPKHAKGET